jgi:formylglycine-generating enzyme required for sulfatase activity
MPALHGSLQRHHPLAQGLPPPWACEWGEDRYGPWCLFRVKEAGQRLRWIPPGRFVMGSPPDEVGRSDSEGPQQTRVISQGFWLFDTPCTQALWEAVMAGNPSRFQSPGRPVERVTWDDCQAFVTRLNGLLERLELSLPSEAQWEYACRAGTTTATYAGDLEIRGENDAPLLDGIAWYAGNCGMNYELAVGQDIASWEEKAYDSRTGGTHPVGAKAPNAWGLHDMLGNVWQWCQDQDRGASGGTPGAERGPAARVVRGGSWDSNPRCVRSGYRILRDPGFRSDGLGFRCGEFRAATPSER